MMAIFNFFGSILGYLLWLLYNIFHNYGVAIIFFTIIIKAVLFPFSVKSQRSMASQTKLADKQKELQAKYGNNKQKYNEEHGITPQTIKKSVRDLISISKEIAKEEVRFEKDPESMDEKELKKLIADVEKKMKKAASELNFEAAAELRDKMVDLKKTLEKIKE